MTLLELAFKELKSFPLNSINPLDCSNPSKALAKEDFPEPDSQTNPVVIPL